MLEDGNMGKILRHMLLQKELYSWCFEMIEGVSENYTMLCKTHNRAKGNK